jgi:dTDP-4-dehydrorhamnose 3,5-epimerase
MRLEETALPGVVVLVPERREDARGFFARTFDRQAFAACGMETVVEQCSVSFNHRRGTIRGLHWQVAPFAEAKLVRVTRGAVHDVVVDVRPGSPTRGRHVAVTMSAETGTQLYVPPGFGHGFQTLEDATEVSYQISAPYSPEHARGVRFDDPTLGIAWPEPVTVISDRDLLLPWFAELEQ